MIPKVKIELIRSSLDQGNVAAILQYLGYDICYGYKFYLREERSPSASIRRDGYIRDFGGDFSGDLINLLMEYHKMSFQEAVEYIATCLGVKL